MTATIQSSPLLITARDAAGLLSISSRTLWTLTDNGDLPVVRVGRSVRYAVEDIHAFIDASKQKGNKPDECDTNRVNEVAS